VIPGVRRRLLALAAIAGGIALAWSPVVKVYSTGQAGLPPTSVIHSAAVAVLAASAATGVLWGLIVALRSAAAHRGGELAAAARRAATIAAVAAVALPVAGGLIRISSIEHTVSTQWHAFVDLKPASASGASTRLFTGAGNRYDYWRIAWNVFLHHPLAGVGAGNYVQYYFVQRSTTEAIQNPHSIELQTLSELGVIGAAALLLIVAGVVVAVARMRPAARGPGTARTLMVAAVGVVVVWLVDSSGDWMPLLPGVTAVALAAVAVLSRTYGPEPAPRRAFAPTSAGVRLPALAGAAAVGVVLAIAGASLLRAGLTQLYLDGAHSKLAAHPASAITDARRALRLDAANLDAYYVEAAGLARFDRAAASRAILLDAAREDPGEYVTWVLLGDLEVRAGDLRAARTYYRRARALDPNDPAVASLAADPASALNRTTG
jgi:tetratricopeptide (TPR) repeat protein